jgi:hypothetical protein
LGTLQHWFFSLADFGPGSFTNRTAREEATMMSLIGFRPHLSPTLAVLFVSGSLLIAQEQPKTTFYEVQISKDEIYRYTNLKFKGDYTSFESLAGLLALGRTEAGVTLLIVLGEGMLQIEAPEAAQEKFRTVFGSYPLKLAFKSVYVRLNPKEYEEAFGQQQLVKDPDEGALAKAKEIFDQRFLASYHAGTKAILPPYKTRVLDFDTPDKGQITNEEGYWLILRRVSPYASVYPSRFVNPKQR